MAKALNHELGKKRLPPRILEEWKKLTGSKEFIQAHKDSYEKRPEKMKLQWEEWEKKKVEELEKEFNLQ